MYIPSFLQRKPEGITIEDCMDALGVKKQLSDSEKERVCIIKDINSLASKLSKAKGGKGPYLSPAEFDHLYDLSIEQLGSIESTLSQQYELTVY